MRLAAVTGSIELLSPLGEDQCRWPADQCTALDGILLWGQLARVCIFMLAVVALSLLVVPLLRRRSYRLLPLSALSAIVGSLCFWLALSAVDTYRYLTAAWPDHSVPSSYIPAWETRIAQAHSLFTELGIAAIIGTLLMLGAAVWLLRPSAARSTVAAA
jgi:hypothetical protein